MSQASHIAAIAMVTLLPLLTGSLLVTWFVSSSNRLHPALAAGFGYILGIYATRIFLQTLVYVGLEFSYLPVIILLLVISCMLGFAIYRSPAAEKAYEFEGGIKFAWQAGFAMLLLALIGLRYWIISKEILMLPIYSWDAWMNWAPKSLVWFQYKNYTAFVSPQDWLTHSSIIPVYTLGNWHSSEYPETVPFIHLWGMLALGQSQTTVPYLQWVMVTASISLSIYGGLRQLRVPVIVALTGCYLFNSVPYVNVHTVLAGYADIWLAATTTASGIALAVWAHTGNKKYIALSLVFAFMCSQIKNPGIFVGLILMGVAAIYALGVSRRTALMLVLTPVLAYLCLAALSFEFTLPILGRVYISGNSVEIANIGYFQIKFRGGFSSFFSTLFVSKNWSLFWYIVALSAVLVLSKRDAFRTNSLPDVTAFLCLVLFIMFVYLLTDHNTNLTNYTSVNRAILYLVPLGIFILFSFFSPKRHSDRAKLTDILK
jgi:hypothetical protein